MIIFEEQAKEIKSIFKNHKRLLKAEQDTKAEKLLDIRSACE